MAAEKEPTVQWHTALAQQPPSNTLVHAHCDGRLRTEELAKDPAVAAGMRRLLFMAKQGKQSWKLPAVSGRVGVEDVKLEQSRKEVPQQMYHERWSDVFGVHIEEAHARHYRTTDHAAEDKTHVYELRTCGRSEFSRAIGVSNSSVVSHIEPFCWRGWSVVKFLCECCAVLWCSVCGVGGSDVAR